MTIVSPVLAADLRDLLSDLGVDSYDLPASAAMLRRNLRLAVRSVLGFSLTVQHGTTPPVSLHVVDGPLHLGQVATSLRVPIGPVEPGRSVTTVTFYADRPGALVELAADLTEALTLPLDAAELDGPLPAEVISSGWVGLVEFTVASQAVGALVAQGLSVEEAQLAHASRLGATGPSRSPEDQS